MTTIQPAPASPDPRHLLAGTRALTRHVRDRQRGGWFALLVLAAATFASIPFDRYATRAGVVHCTQLGPGRTICTAYSSGAIWYWPVALVLSYGLISAFYVRRSRQNGVGIRVRPFVVVGLALIVLVTVWSLWALHDPSVLAHVVNPGSAAPVGATLSRLATPAGAIGIALLVLAWTERSVPLFVTAAAYLVVVLTAAGRHVHHAATALPAHVSPWAFLPHVLLLGTVLLVGGIVTWWIQRKPEPVKA